MRSLAPLAPVLAFCGADVADSDDGFLHARSVARWRADRHFGFQLDADVAELAGRFGYAGEDLDNTATPTWPAYRRLGRAGFRARGALGRLRLRSTRAAGRARAVVARRGGHDATP